MTYWYTFGFARLLQTLIVMGFGVLTVATLARDAYSVRGWVWRASVMVIAFVPLLYLDFGANQGVETATRDDGLGNSIHFMVLGIASLITVGTFLAAVLAQRRRLKAGSVGGWPEPSPQERWERS